MTCSPRHQSKKRKEPAPVNHYAAIARRHWQQWLPERYAQIPDPDSFFSTLGQEAASQIADLMMDLAGDDPPGEDYLTKAGRLTAARSQAEEIVLNDLLPDPGQTPDNPQPPPGQAPAR
jgi:hypothetical protein